MVKSAQLLLGLVAARSGSNGGVDYETPIPDEFVEEAALLKERIVLNPKSKGGQKLTEIDPEEKSGDTKLADGSRIVYMNAVGTGGTEPLTEWVEKDGSANKKNGDGRGENDKTEETFKADAEKCKNPGDVSDVIAYKGRDNSEGGSQKEIYVIHTGVVKDDDEKSWGTAPDFVEGQKSTFLAYYRTIKAFLSSDAPGKTTALAVRMPGLLEDNAPTFQTDGEDAAAGKQHKGYRGAKTGPLIVKEMGTFGLAYFAQSKELREKSQEDDTKRQFLFFGGNSNGERGSGLWQETFKAGNTGFPLTAFSNGNTDRCNWEAKAGKNAMSCANVLRAAMRLAKDLSLPMDKDMKLEDLHTAVEKLAGTAPEESKPEEETKPEGEGQAAGPKTEDKEQASCSTGCIVLIILAVVAVVAGAVVTALMMCSDSDAEV